MSGNCNMRKKLGGSPPLIKSVGLRSLSLASERCIVVIFKIMLPLVCVKTIESIVYTCWRLSHQLNIIPITVLSILCSLLLPESYSFKLTHIYLSSFSWFLELKIDFPFGSEGLCLKGLSEDQDMLCTYNNNKAWIKYNVNA